MKRVFTTAVIILTAGLAGPAVSAQQIPYLSELLSRSEQYYTRLNQKRAGSGAAAIEPLRKRGEAAFLKGDVPGLIEVLSEGIAILDGKPWDDRSRFIASLTLETDRLVIEPNKELQISLTRMFQANADKAFPLGLTVTFQVVAQPGDPQPIPAPIIIADQLRLAETMSNASRKLLLPDGAYLVVARVETGGQKVADVTAPLYAIGGFTDSLAQMSKQAAEIRRSTDSKVKAVASLVTTPEFQIARLTPLNKSRIEASINPIEELDRIENELGALAAGKNPFSAERGEVERAYRASDGVLVPYRLYVPRNYDPSKPAALVLMLHGALGDERSYFSGIYDPGLIKAEADRRGCILAAVNGRGRFGGYRGPAGEDPFEVLNAVTRDYSIDASRVYLTGHSMGGFGAWLVATQKPEAFAAMAPVSGGAPVEAAALPALLEKLKGLPVLIVHGAKDGIVSPDQSRSMQAAAQKAGLRTTLLELPNADHITAVAASFQAVMDFFDKNTRGVPPK